MEQKEKELCPYCGRPLPEFPAISRRDDLTKICSECGIKDAMIDFFGGNNGNTN